MSVLVLASRSGRHFEIVDVAVPEGSGSSHQCQEWDGKVKSVQCSGTHYVTSGTCGPERFG